MYGRIGTIYLAQQHLRRKQGGTGKGTARPATAAPSGAGMSEAAMFLRLGLVVLIAVAGAYVFVGLGR